MLTCTSRYVMLNPPCQVLFEGCNMCNMAPMAHEVCATWLMCPCADIGQTGQAPAKAPQAPSSEPLNNIKKLIKHS